MSKTTALALAAMSLVVTSLPASAFDTRNMSSTTTAGSTTVSRGYGGVDLSRNWSVGAGATTIYSQPGYGANGPINGTQRGSGSSTSYGGMLEYRFR